MTSDIKGPQGEMGIRVSALESSVIVIPTNKRAFQVPSYHILTDMRNNRLSVSKDAHIELDLGVSNERAVQGPEIFVPQEVLNRLIPSTSSGK